MDARDGIEVVACKTGGERMRLLAIEPVGGDAIWTELRREAPGRWVGVSTGRVDANGASPEAVAMHVLGSRSHRVDSAVALPGPMLDAVLSPVEPYALAFVLDSMDASARDRRLSDELPEGVTLPDELQAMAMVREEAEGAAEALGRDLSLGCARADSSAMGGRVAASISRRDGGSLLAEVECDGRASSLVAASEADALDAVQSLLRAEMLRLLAEQREREEEQDRRDEDRDAREGRWHGPKPNGDGTARRSPQ